MPTSNTPKFQYSFTADFSQPIFKAEAEIVVGRIRVAKAEDTVRDTNKVIHLQGFDDLYIRCI